MKGGKRKKKKIKERKILKITRKDGKKECGEEMNKRRAKRNK